jgi:hypothetical protein
LKDLEGCCHLQIPRLGLKEDFTRSPIVGEILPNLFIPIKYFTKSNLQTRNVFICHDLWLIDLLSAQGTSLAMRCQTQTYLMTLDLEQMESSDFKEFSQHFFFYADHSNLTWISPSIYLVLSTFAKFFLSFHIILITMPQSKADS